MTRRLHTLGAALALTAAATGAAGAGAARTQDDPRSAARVSPAVPGKHQPLQLSFRASGGSYRATYVVKTAGPRPGCATRRVATERYADGVEAGDRIRFTIAAPRRGWCAGVHRVYLLAEAYVDTADGDCDVVPEYASSDCPEELRFMAVLDRRTRFTVR